MHRVLAESLISGPKENVVFATEDVISKSCSKFLSGYSPKPGEQQMIIRAQSDKLDYKLIELNNGLRILLISDPSYKDLKTDAESDSKLSDSDMSDAESGSGSGSDTGSEMSSGSTKSTSMSKEKIASIVVGVNIGSFKDPVDAQGMAHLLEHLLTMGSEKYPSESEIDDFLTSRGGYQNAMTECEHTIYEIIVNKPYLKKTIDMIGQSFVAPLLRKESIEKEIKPIDTEFSEASNDDDVRLELLLGNIANKEHPMSCFLWGNYKSLITLPKSKNVDIHQLVVDFYKRYYNPENIIVAIQAQESLQNLQDWSVDVFSKVKSKSHLLTSQEPCLPTNSLSLPFYPFDSTFHKLYYVESIVSGVRLIVHWNFPPTIDKYLASPLEYLSLLLGDESKGSFLSQLRKEDLAVELVTSVDQTGFYKNKLSTIFTLNINLTTNGETKIDKVVELLFEYLAVIRKAGAQEFLFLENQQITRNSFNMSSEKDPLHHSIDLLKNLMYYPIEHMLISDKVFYYFDKACIDEYLAKFLPEHANFILHGAKFHPDKKILSEPWMETKYQEFPVPSSWVETARSKTGVSDYFRYPLPNRFIATQFDLLADTLPLNAPERKQGIYPSKIYEAQRMLVWHKCDFKFRLPKASINILIMSPFYDDCIENAALNDIFHLYLLVSLKEDAYAALVANLKWNIRKTQTGMLLKASGFNHKLFELVIIILEKIISLEFEDCLLSSIKKKVIEDYENAYQDAESFNSNLRLSILIKDYYPLIDRLGKVLPINKDDLMSFKSRLLSNISFEMLVQGNIDIQQTLNLSKKIEEMFALVKQTSEPYQKRKDRILQLPQSYNIVRGLTPNKTARVSYVVHYQQLGSFNLKSECYLVLFAEMINNICFNILRTKEGLGYRVGCYQNYTYGVLGLSVYVGAMAEKFDCTFIEKRINQFIESDCKEYIFKSLTPADFEKYVQSAIKFRESPDVSLSTEVKRNLGEVVSFEYGFNRNQLEISFFKKATLKEFLQWTTENIFSPADKKRILNVQIVGNGEKAFEECSTQDNNKVTISMIPSHFKEHKRVQLFKSTDNTDHRFISDIKSFKQNLPLVEIDLSDLN